MQYPARDKAKLFLAEVLKDGPRPSREVFSLAAAAGIATKTLRRAQKDLRIRCRPRRGPGASGWLWCPPRARKS